MNQVIILNTDTSGFSNTFLKAFAKWLIAKYQVTWNYTILFKNNPDSRSGNAYGKYKINIRFDRAFYRGKKNITDTDHRFKWAPTHTFADGLEYFVFLVGHELKHSLIKAQGKKFKSCDEEYRANDFGNQVSKDFRKDKASIFAEMRKKRHAKDNIMVVTGNTKELDRLFKYNDRYAIMAFKPAPRKIVRKPRTPRAPATPVKVVTGNKTIDRAIASRPDVPVEVERFYGEDGRNWEVYFRGFCYDNSQHLYHCTTAEAAYMIRKATKCYCGECEQNRAVEKEENEKRLDNAFAIN